MLAVVLYYRGVLAFQQGDQVTARAFYEESLAMLRTFGDRRTMVVVLGLLGHTHQQLGESARANAVFRESLHLAWEVRDRADLGLCFDGLPRATREQGQPYGVARLFAAAAEVRAAGGITLLPVERAAHQPTLETLQARLGSDVFAVEWAAGQHMSLEDVAAEAFGLAAGASVSGW